MVLNCLPCFCLVASLSLSCRQLKVGRPGPKHCAGKTLGGHLEEGQLAHVVGKCTTTSWLVG